MARTQGLCRLVALRALCLGRQARWPPSSAGRLGLERWCGQVQNRAKTCTTELSIPLGALLKSDVRASFVCQYCSLCPISELCCHAPGLTGSAVLAGSVPRSPAFVANRISLLRRQKRKFSEPQTWSEWSAHFLGGKSINQRKPLLWSGIAGQTEIWATKTTNNHFCGRGRSPRLNSGPTKPRTNTSEPFARAGGGFFAPICDQLKPFWPHRFPGQNHKKPSRRTSCTAQAWAKSGPRPPEPTRAQFPEGLLAGVWRFGPAPPVRESRIRGLSGKASGRTRNPGMARLSAMGRRL